MFDCANIHSYDKMFYSQKKPSFAVRRIKSIKIIPGKALAFDNDHRTSKNAFEYWDIRIKAKSFVHMQVSSSCEQKMIQCCIYKCCSMFTDAANSRNTDFGGRRKGDGERCL